MTQMHKVQIDGWILKNDKDVDISKWGIEQLMNSMVEYTVQSTLLDVLHDGLHKPNTVSDSPLIKNDLQEAHSEVIQISNQSPPSVNISSNETMDVSISSDEEGTFNGI